MPELPAQCLVNLRLVTVPDAAPPYDCPVHGSRCQAVAAAGPAPADVVPAGAGLAPAAEAAPAAAVTPAAAAAPADPTAAGPAPAEVAPAAAADPTTAWPRQLALVIVEVLAGARPDRQLVPLATDRVRARARGLAPLVASGRRPRVVRIVTSRPAAGVVELTVVVDFGPRSRALAMRFEHVAARRAAPGWPARPARWLCTALEAG
ncbi:MAG TPA: Rv3235 family protein [Streptosporangiaceae bacterium]|nr:Rv3235 family protein [Streptosporangiaceae bacterium]